jgi:hypothetical protein
MYSSMKPGPTRRTRRIEPGTVEFNMSVAESLSKEFRDQAEEAEEVMKEKIAPRGTIGRILNLRPGRAAREQAEQQLRGDIEELKAALKKQQAVYDANFGLVALEDKGLPQDLIMTNISPFLQPTPKEASERSVIVDMLRPRVDRDLRYPTDIPSQRPTISRFTEDPLHNQGLVNY